MKTVEPITLVQQRLVVAETEKFIDMASQLFEKKLPQIPVHFDLIGRTAGMYKVRRNTSDCERVIRFNPYIFSKYWDENFSVTIPHEVAHYVVDLHTGMAKVKPHGREWKTVMSAFKVDDSRTFSFSLEGVPQRTTRTFPYRCQCRDHQLTIRRHKRVLLHNASYMCRYCKQPLTPCSP